MIKKIKLRKYIIDGRLFQAYNIRALSDLNYLGDGIGVCRFCKYFKNRERTCFNIKSPLLTKNSFYEYCSSLDEKVKYNSSKTKTFIPL